MMVRKRTDLNHQPRLQVSGSIVHVGAHNMGQFDPFRPEGFDLLLKKMRFL
jgi:hypothetical protein